ncbi:hypothetical protein RA279_30525, partial [Pseudomonas syringae pv. tagetis]
MLLKVRTFFLGSVFPGQFCALRIQRMHFVMRLTHIYPVVDLQMRGFKGVLAGILACIPQVAGM